jgi:glycosyltransferase involved in cell wall biosynthesis
MAERIRALGSPSDKVRVARLPADGPALSRCATKKAGEFLVVIAGRFIEKKGFDVALEAFGHALRGRADARLLMLGWGPLEDEYRAAASRLGFADQVEWAGRLPFHRFMSRLAEGHVALYPSREAASGDSEGGAPVTLIEAQWLGVPSIVSDHDDLPFVAAPEGSLTIPCRAVDQWAEALRALYADRSVVDRMSAAASAFAREKHSPKANAAAREAIYESTR